jgi:thioredoxin reductase (NADPH)
MESAQQTLPETPDPHGAYPRLSDEQVAALSRLGQRRQVEAGEVLFREGDPSCDFFVVLEGRVAIVEGHGSDDERLLSTHGPRRFLGELNLLSGQAVFVTAVAREPGEVLQVPVERLRELVASDPALGDLILSAYLIRRWILIGLGTGFRIVGSRYSPDTRRLREFAARNRLPHRFIDLEKDREAEALLHELGIGLEQTPVVLWRSQVLRNPRNAEVAAAIGLPTPKAVATLCDLIVVGAGPAGLAAAVYGASEGLDTVAIDAIATGGQAGTSSRIENYLGFPAGISGGDLAERASLQAEKFGARINVPAEALGLSDRGDHYEVTLDEEGALAGRTVVVATGARYRKLPLPRLEEFERTSIYYSATPMEAQLCAAQPIVVVGGGNSAGQATLFLAKHAGNLRLVVRERELTENMSRYLADRIERDPRIEVLLHTELRELLGDDALDAVVAEDTVSGARRTLEAKALFVFIGADPHADWLGDGVALDDGGYVLTGAETVANGHERAGAHEPLLLETSAPGVFAAGDVRSGSIKRVASAVGEGAMAVRLVHEHLQTRQT